MTSLSLTGLCMCIGVAAGIGSIDVRTAEAQSVSRSLCDSTFASRPTETPGVSALPRVLNRDQLKADLQESFAPLGDVSADMKGPVVLWALVSGEGSVERVSLRKSSGSAAVDSAAMRVFRAADFSPAVHNGKAVCFWVMLPVMGPEKGSNP